MNTATLSHPAVRTLALDNRRLLVIKDRPGTRIRVLSGRVWMTEQGQPGDQFAGAGEELQIQRRGRSVVEALGTARVRLIEPARRDALRLSLGLALLRREPGAWAVRAVALSLSVMLAFGVPELLVRGMHPFDAGAAMATLHASTSRG